MTLAMAFGIQAGASIVGGLFGRSAAKKKAKAAKAMAQYNANVARVNAEAESDAIEFSARRLAKQQRELQAQQRMSIASRGGTLGGTDLLMVLDQAEQMQLDQLELQRQSDIATITGEQQARSIIFQGQQQAQIAKAEGRAAMAQGLLGAASAYAGFKAATYTPPKPE